MPTNEDAKIANEDAKIGAVAATGGSRPSETGPGATGGTATGGGQAVPSAEVLMGGSALGDTGSLDDTAGNSGDTVADEAKASATPKMSPSGPDTQKDADAPSGGLGGSSVGRS